MNNKRKESYNPSNKVNQPQNHHEQPWLGNPDDHEPTMKVEKDEVNP